MCNYYYNSVSRFSFNVQTSSMLNGKLTIMIGLIKIFRVENTEQDLFPGHDPSPSLPPSLLFLVLSLPLSVVGITGRIIPALIRRTVRKSNERDQHIFLMEGSSWIEGLSCVIGVTFISASPRFWEI